MPGPWDHDAPPDIDETGHASPRLAPGAWRCPNPACGGWNEDRHFPRCTECDNPDEPEPEETPTMTDPERILSPEEIQTLIEKRVNETHPLPPTDLQLRTAAPPAQMSVEDVIKQTLLVQEVMRAVMKEKTHYGKIPGVDKPSLFKPGAEKLCLVFRMDPEYQVESKTEQTEAPWHVGYVMRCTLYHQPTGMRLGSGMGSATTREPKWSEVNASLKCPTCGKAAIIKGKAEYGGGYVCFKKKDGCGAKFNDSHTAITSQSVGKTARESVAEVHNTVLKMACKRALVAAVLNTTAASDIFTQDLEDLSAALHEEGGPAAPPPPKKKSKADAAFAAKTAAGQAAFDAAEEGLSKPLPESEEEEHAPEDTVVPAEKVRELWAALSKAGLDENALRGAMAARGLASTKTLTWTQHADLMAWIRLVAAWPDKPAEGPADPAPSPATAGGRVDGH